MNIPWTICFSNRCFLNIPWFEDQNIFTPVLNPVANDKETLHFRAIKTGHGPLLAVQLQGVPRHRWFRHLRAADGAEAVAEAQGAGLVGLVERRKHVGGTAGHTGDRGSATRSGGLTWLGTLGLPGLGNVYIANWKDPPIFHGKIHYFYGHFQ